MFKRNLSVLPTDGALNADALVQVYLAIRPKLERAIARRVGSTTLAHDLAQDIYLRIGAIKVSFATRTDAERYLLRMAANAAFDHLKVERRRSTILEESSPVFQHPSPSPDAGVLAGDVLRQLEDALAELPARCRDVLMLNRMEGLSHAEIATRLGVSQSLVQKYAIRSLLHCRRRLAQENAQK